MDDKQKFQKPWQLFLLQIHGTVERWVFTATRPLVRLVSPTYSFFEKFKL